LTDYGRKFGFFFFVEGLGKPNFVSAAIANCFSDSQLLGWHIDYKESQMAFTRWGYRYQVCVEELYQLRYPLTWDFLDHLLS